MRSEEKIHQSKIEWRAENLAEGGKCDVLGGGFGYGKTAEGDGEEGGFKRTRSYGRERTCILAKSGKRGIQKFRPRKNDSEKKCPARELSSRDRNAFHWGGKKNGKQRRVERRKVRRAETDRIASKINE